KIPNELWLGIFADATYIPEAMTCNDGESIERIADDQNAIHLHRWHREAMDTNLAIALVSRRWNALVAEFLFRYILLKDGDHAIHVAAALASRHQRSRTPVAGPGRWTIRLELALEGVHIWKKEHLRALGRIFKSCPNLRVFSTIACTSDPHLWEWCALTRTISKGLKQVHIRRLECRGEHESLLQVLVPHLAPSLEMLWVSPPSSTSRQIVYSFTHLDFPQLRSLIISDNTRTYKNSLLTCNTPALTHLVVTGSPSSTSSPHDVGEFVQRSGQRLRRLNALHHGQLGLLEMCPNLSHWVL
ncbi:uncharacterized protein LAESUDRAFT_618524, partial [Laetiporus sulphureus 93-53]